MYVFKTYIVTILSVVPRNICNFFVVLIFSGSSLLLQAIRGEDITVKSYKVESRITSRFAQTTVRSSVVNSGSKAQSIGFNVQIPKQAFITNFTM